MTPYETFLLATAVTGWCAVIWIARRAGYWRRTANDLAFDLEVARRQRDNEREWSKKIERLWDKANTDRSAQARAAALIGAEKRRAKLQAMQVERTEQLRREVDLRAEVDHLHEKYAIGEAA